MDREVEVDSVEVTETRNKNRRWVLRDSEGNEYTTFRPRIGEETTKYEGRRARISYHEEERGGFQNVYLDGIAPASSDGDSEGDGDGDGDEQNAEEAAWQTAVEAAPWLIGKRGQVDPDELFDKLKPFQERVAADIREEDDANDRSGNG